jgi:hypothetical protein
MSHWEHEAKDLVVRVLVRGALDCDKLSIIGRLAEPQLWALANSVDPELVKEVLAERDRCLAGFAGIMHAYLVNAKR